MSTRPRGPATRDPRRTFRDEADLVEAEPGAVVTDIEPGTEWLPRGNAERAALAARTRAARAGGRSTEDAARRQASHIRAQRAGAQAQRDAAVAARASRSPAPAPKKS